MGVSPLNPNIADMLTKGKHVDEGIDDAEDTSRNMIIKKESGGVQINVSKTKRSKKSKAPKDARIAMKRQVKGIKSKICKKKGFKENTLTVKFKLSEIHAKAGTFPDFALFIKDNVHSPDVRNAANYAGKYITFIKGNLADKFFTEEGISFDPKEFFICENGVDLTELQSSRLADIEG